MEAWAMVRAMVDNTPTNHNNNGSKNSNTSKHNNRLNTPYMD